MTAKRIRQDTEAKGNWTELTFEKTGFKTKYTSPTLKSSKYGIHLYRVDFKDGQHVRIFKNGSKVGILADERGNKKLKANKSGSRLTIGGKKVVKELALESGVTLAGVKAEIMGKQGWVFE